MTSEEAMSLATDVGYDYLLSCTYDLCKALDIDQDEAGWQERLSSLPTVHENKCASSTFSPPFCPQSAND
jgi:hypothetical protein